MSSRNGELVDKAVGVIAQVLCDGAFVFADPMEPGSRPEIGSWKPVGVTVTFDGARRGAVSLWAEEPFVIQVAANMLGVEDGGMLGLEKGWDALKEMLNMVAGNLLTSLFGTEAVFDLGLPCSSGRETLEREVSERYCLWLDAEGTPVLFTLLLQE